MNIIKLLKNTNSLTCYHRYMNMIKTALKTLLSVLAIYFLNSLNFSNYFLLALMLIIFYLFFKNTTKYKRNTVLLSLILSLLLLLGKYKIYLDDSNGFLLATKLIITPIGSYILFQHLFGYIFNALDNKKIKTITPISYKLSFIIAFLIITISWLTILIIKYPGIIYPDTLNQIIQSFGDRPFNNMNPLFHTLLIKLVYDIVLSFNKNVNVATFVVSLIQLITCALIYAYICKYIYKRTNNIYFYLCSLLFYGFISYNVFYNISISKDAMYAVFTALFVCMIDNLCQEPSNKYIILFVLTGILYSLLRNNGFYSLIVVVMIMIVLCKKFNFKKLTITMLVTLILTGVVRSPIYSVVLDLSNIKYAENNPIIPTPGFVGSFLFVVPFQQIANVVVHDRELNEKEEWLIEEYIPFEQIKKVYNPILIDPLYSEIEKYCKPSRLDINKIEYLKLWVELFLKYPLDYLEAYVNMNKYYFYPNKYVENMYYTSIYPNEYGIEYTNNNKKLVNKIETIYNEQRDIPLVSSVFSPGTIVFILMIGLYYCLLKKNKTTFISMFHLLVNFLILMAFVPLNDEFRYIYPVVACLPLIITQTISNVEYKEGNAK